MVVDMKKDFSQLLIPYGKAITYEPNHVLLMPGDRKKTLFYILSGRINLKALSDDGSMKTIYYLEPHNFICELDFFLDCPSTLIVETDSFSTVLEIPFANYEKLWNTNPDFRDRIAYVLSEKVRLLQHEISSICFKSVQHRLFSYFYTTKIDQSETEDGWVDLKYHHTQTELAEIIGSNRATVNREISKLCEYGYVRKLNNRLQINIKRTPPYFSS